MSPSEAAQAIWKAGVAAVDSSRLIHGAVSRDATGMEICGERFEWNSIGRVVVVGAGKAGAGMAAGVEEVLGDKWVDDKVEGWINVPADCVRPLRRIRLHAARPAGLNEPTEEGVIGSRQILELVESLSENDLCLVLISGGGSALLPLPIEGVSLADKLAVTRQLSRSGATIQELNAVRKRLSAIKGGGLHRAARAGTMRTLIISDVIGDPLDVIASGPTVCDEGAAADAMAVLKKLLSPADQVSLPKSVWNVLQTQIDQGDQRLSPTVVCVNHIIGNNQTALLAAMEHANQLGYDVESLGAGRGGIARDIGVELAEQCLKVNRQLLERPKCFVGGGEPIVKLAPTDQKRIGGRNQEVALSACCRLWSEDIRGIAILSGGTDGEDGPTDAAGAICDQTVLNNARQRRVDPFAHLSINDSYTFFNQVGGLLRTGPTHTNVMDLQVAIVHPQHA